MVACPVCSGEIEEDFGLVECSHCGAPVLLSGDGVEETEEQHSHELSEEPVGQVEDFLAPAEDAVSEELDAFEQEPVTEELVDSPAPIETPTLNVNDFVDDQSPSPGADLGLSYSVLIRGIDTAAIRRDVKDTISDSKFRLDTEALMGGLANGELRIRKLTPVKAALLVQRLRTLPIDLSWEQERV